MATSRLQLIRHFLSNSSENWKIRSTTTAASPIPTTVNTSTLSLRTTALFLAARHTIGGFTAALDREARTVVLRAKAGLTNPCIASVAAAAVVLALLTSPSNTQSQAYRNCQTAG